MTANSTLINALVNGVGDEHAVEALISLFRNISDIITLLDVQGNILYQSSSMRQTMDYEENELQGKNIFEVTHPEDHQLIKDQFAAALQKPGPGPTAEFRLLNRSGNYIYLEAQGNNQLHNPSINAMIIISRDITRRKIAENALLHTYELTKFQNDQLQSFSQILSHNIRSHSANLSSIVEFMEGAETEEENKLFFQMLKTSTEKLEETIQHLNDILHINDNVSSPKENMHLRTEVESSLASLQALLLQKNVSVKSEIPDHYYIKVIPAFLNSILLNIISNAIKYCDSTRDPRIEISAVRQGLFIVVSVKDNGFGIDLEKYENQLFGLYKTFHGNEDAKGLGLFLTKNQIEAMGGKIEVESTVGEGSIFKLYFKD